MATRRDVEDLDGGTAVDLLKIQTDVLLVRGRDVLTHEVGADGQLAMAAVNEDGELDAAGATQVHDGVEGGADGAAGVENICLLYTSDAADEERV